MVKKSIIALVIIALKISTVQAGEPAFKYDPGQWPWEYKAIDICKLPVYMEVGHYVQLKDCHKRELILEQVPCALNKPEGLGKSEGDFPCYTGCEEIEVRANFPAIFGASLSKTSGILDQTSLYWKDDKNTINGSLGGEAWEKLIICLDAWKVKLWQAGTANAKAKVGEITINVKPPDTGF